MNKRVFVKGEQEKRHDTPLFHPIVVTELIRLRVIPFHAIFRIHVHGNELSYDPWADFFFVKILNNFSNLTNSDDLSAF